jgi:hypothetical protein
MIDPATGHGGLVGTLERGGVSWGLAVSPDGKFLYQRTVREGSDLMLIENFR